MVVYHPCSTFGSTIVHFLDKQPGRKVRYLILFMALSKNRKSILYLIIFVCFTALYGAIVAIINNLLRTHGIEKGYSIPLLIFSTVYVYWKAWQLLCRKLDKISA